MTRLLRYALAASAVLGIASVSPVAAQTAANQTASDQPSNPFGTIYAPGKTASSAQAPSAEQQRHGGEHFRARGRRSLPPGYQDTPSNDFQHGPDPDHLSSIERDAATGADIGKFGSAYQQSNPVQSGQLGDATGNGMVAPRGNGW